MGERGPEISVIIRTRGDDSRRASLRRAIDSVLEQEGVQARCIVVFNAVPSTKLPPELEEPNPNILLLSMAREDKALATSVGRAAVQTKYFTFLDDDDELLADSLAYRVRFLERDRSLDCLATNGEYVIDGASRPALVVKSGSATDYADEILRGRNWLASCGAVFRTHTICQEFFEHLPVHFEWTVIGFRIAVRRKVKYVNVPTYRIYSTPDSQSKIPNYVDTPPEIVDDMHRWNDAYRRLPLLLRRRAVANHEACSHYRLNGNFARAWHYHWKSLSNVFGLDYVPYTLLLLARSRAPIPTLNELFKGSAAENSP